MDHTTERAEKVISELTGQFSEMLRQWLHKIADRETVTLGELEADVRSGLHSLGEEVLQGLVDVMGSGKTKYPPCHPPDSARVFNDNDSEQQSSAARCTASMFAKTPR